ncbi:unnamed protein product [Ceutorhynchus assimilis]|uniref:Uncharacterized protein n=1 Tax=Ceutorhynchus assimilis TaxID=467358 RepID=A0A9N9MF04_9CUCU|nr:unnamed protein product [Ceutorhynchus assimilis]
MAKLMVLVGFCLVGFGAGMPASNEQLDKATVNDVAINAVSEEKKPVEVPQQPSTVEISGISTGINPAPANPVAPQDNGGFKPQRATSMFARIIDDIFQIPITVLQNVARLITNPFSQARKEVAPAAS